MNVSAYASHPSLPHFDICVLIPVFNNRKGLEASLKSIIYNSGKLCVVVVDDGSDEKPEVEKIFSEAGNGFTIFSVLLPENRGITEALNAGLAWIGQNLRVNYIARLDCNDVCSPDRFYKQAAFLDAHPEIGLLGSWVTFASADGSLQYNYTTPVSHTEIMKEMYFRNVFIHPAVMFRAALLTQTGFYPKGFRHVEDYAFFWEMLNYTRGAILPELLVTCEINAQGISQKNRKSQLQGRLKVINHYGNSGLWYYLGIIKMKLLMLLPYTLVLMLKTCNNAVDKSI